MTLKIDPKAIVGKWDEGFSLDAQTLSSTFLGYNEYGHPMFDTARTAVGESLYKLKYGQDREQLAEIVVTVEAFLKDKSLVFDSLVAVPPSRFRKIQPVLEIASELSKKLAVTFESTAVKKIRATPELKNVSDAKERAEALTGAFEIDAEKVKGKRILLIDDLYQTGASLNAVSEALKKAGALSVFALTLTRARNSA